MKVSLLFFFFCSSKERLFYFAKEDRVKSVEFTEVCTYGSF